jgi:hypothetical protein
MTMAMITRATEIVKKKRSITREAHKQFGLFGGGVAMGSCTRGEENERLDSFFLPLIIISVGGEGDLFITGY